MKPLKQKVSVTLDENIINTIKELAEDQDRSFSQYINMVLRQHIEAQRNDGTRSTTAR